MSTLCSPRPLPRGLIVPRIIGAREYSSQLVAAHDHPAIVGVLRQSRDVGAVVAWTARRIVSSVPPVRSGATNATIALERGSLLTGVGCDVSGCIAAAASRTELRRSRRTEGSNPAPSSGESGANPLLIGHGGGTPQARIRSSAGQRRVRSYGIALPSRQQIVHRASRPRQISGCGSE